MPGSKIQKKFFTKKLLLGTQKKSKNLNSKKFVTKIQKIPVKCTHIIPVVNNATRVIADWFVKWKGRMMTCARSPYSWGTGGVWWSETGTQIAQETAGQRRALPLARLAEPISVSNLQSEGKRRVHILQELAAVPMS